MSQQATSPVSLDQLLTESETSDLISLTPRWLQKKRMEGGGIPFVRISSRCVRYRRRDVVQWCEERLAASTSDQLGEQN